MNTNIQTVPVTAETLRKAAELQATIESAQTELAAILSGQVFTATAAPKNGKRARRKMTPKGLANVRAGQKARWEKVRAAKLAAAPAAPVAPVPAKTPTPTAIAA